MNAPQCEFESLEAGTHCRRGCGRRLAFTFSRPPLSDCSATCIHLGLPTGGRVQIELVKRCGGRIERETRAEPVHFCAVFGECLPGYRCDPSALEYVDRPVQVCKGCERFAIS